MTASCRRLLIITLILGSAAASYAQSMFRGNAAHTGEAISDPPKVAGMWKITTGQKVRSTPAVADGVVYFGSNDGNLYAAQTESGKVLWKFDAGAPIASSPAVQDGIVYFQSANNALFALSTQGKWLWTVGTNPSLPVDSGWDYFISSPVLAAGQVIFGSGDGSVYSVDAKSGKKRWVFKTAGNVRATPAVSGGTVFAGSMDGNLYALALETGTLIWKFKTQGNEWFPLGEIQSSAAVSDGRVFFGSRDGRLYAVDAATGKQLWRADHEGSWVITSPAVADGVVYDGSSDGEFVQALDAKTGKELWRQKMPANVFSSPTVSKGLVYVAEWAGHIYWLDAKTGKIVGQWVVQGPVQSSLVLVNGMLFVGSDDDTFYCLR
jgi:outer membrane protein assembly factor BamB